MFIHSTHTRKHISVTFVDPIQINEDKRATARCNNGNQILNQNGPNEDTYNFTKVFDTGDTTKNVFETAMKPLMDYKLQISPCVSICLKSY